MPLEYFKTRSEEESSDCQKDKYWQGNFVVSGSFIENTSYSVGKHCEREVFYYRKTPLRKILIAEEDP
jgi:hypothetical protein